MALMSYGEATKLLSSIRFLKRFLPVFDPTSVDLVEFEESLKVIYKDVYNYRRKLKRDAYSHFR